MQQFSVSVAFKLFSHTFNTSHAVRSLFTVIRAQLLCHSANCHFLACVYLSVSVYRIFTLYSKSLPLDVACRVWDVFCRDGEEFLFRTGLGILRLYEDVLLQMDFIHSAQFLTRLPEDIDSDRLFACIAAMPMLNGNKKWSQVSSSKHKKTGK